MDDVGPLLQRTDSSDQRQSYVAWCELGAHRQEIVPLVAEAYASAKQPLGRESHIYYVTPFARFDDHTVELGVHALHDPRKEVRYRACGLLAHSRRTETVAELQKLERGASKEPARRAIKALREGGAFGADDDPYYFIYGHDPSRAPRGSFADALFAEIGAWLGTHGFHPTYLFQHALELRDAHRVVRADWDSYEIEARISVTRGSPESAEVIRGGPGDIAAMGKVIRALMVKAAT